MTYEVKILADSLSLEGHRLTTMEVTIPRIVLAEFNTHRMFSRNSASSRAIPVEKQIERVINDPFIPVYWGKNQKGMQAEEELCQEAIDEAEATWLDARNKAVDRARDLLAIGVHKQITSRLLEPWMWQTIIVSATEWQNFFALRCHKDAQPEIRRAAEMMRKAMSASSPVRVHYAGWHLPLMPDFDQLELYSPRELAMISAGRCARVSYLTHAGVRDPAADIELANRLQASGHMSPFEHVATPFATWKADAEFDGNFMGWRQLRKYMPGEAVWEGAK